MTKIMQQVRKEGYQETRWETKIMERSNVSNNYSRDASELILHRKDCDEHIGNTVRNDGLATISEIQSDGDKQGAANKK